MKKHIKIIVCISFFALVAQMGFGQYYYMPYYGKNKVNYVNFQWDKYETAHFDIYYYTKDLRTLKLLASYAESAYQKISRDIKHELSAPVPLLFYKTLTDFQQTNLYNIPEGVLGVAEPLLYRVALHGDMPPDELQDLIAHELTHIFEYDLLWGSPGGVIYAVTQPPLWIMEGFSEYNTGNWSSWSSLIVRDTVLNDRMPDMTDRGQLYSRYPMPRDPAYDFGHAIYEFIEEEFGKNAVRELWQSMKNSSFIGRSDPIRKTFNMKPQEFNHEFKKYLRKKNKHLLLRDNPEDYSLPMGPQFPLNNYYFAFSHALSPSGDVVAVLTFSVRDSDIDIVLLSTKDGKVLKNITKGYTLNYEFIRYSIDPSEGKLIAWSSDGDKIAFFGRAGQKHSLFIVNALTGKTLLDVPIPHDQPTSPAFFPDGNALLYIAFDKGIHDIYKVDLVTGGIQNLTQDELYEKAVSISADGTQAAYTIRLDKFDKIFLSPIDNFKKKTQLTFGPGNNITPEFSKDNTEIFFSGDMREAYNIYSVNLGNGDLKRYTDVRTGNFFPAPLPNEPNAVVFSSFNKGSFQIYKSELEPEVEKTLTFDVIEPEETYDQFEPILTLEVNKDEIEAQKGIGKLYLIGRPPVEAVISTDGSIYGGTAIAFSDLFADYTFTILAYQVRSFRSYQFSFYNLKNRLQYAVELYSYTLFYYPSYSYYDPYLYNFMNYSDAISTRDISGATVSAFYPFNRYYRAQAAVFFQRWEEDFYDPYMNQLLDYRNSQYGYFLNGNMLGVQFALVGETTRFKYFGPVSGSTFSVSVQQAIPISESFLSNTTFRADLRKYLHIGGDVLFALRLKLFGSYGKTPYVTYFGGNNEIRSQYYYSLIGTESWFGNLEFRIPIVHQWTTFLGLLGPVRGSLFFDVGRSKMKGREAVYFDILRDDDGLPILDDDGFLQLYQYEAIGSYGFGFQAFFLGFPIHLEFVKEMQWRDFSRPFDWDIIGGWQTKFWIGFDF